jgi:hypothetical protein
MIEKIPDLHEDIKPFVKLIKDGVEVYRELYPQFDKNKGPVVENVNHGKPQVKPWHHRLGL